VRENFMFPENLLVITNIDVQSVEPVDQRTRDSLMKSVQLAIEITTNSQEAAARHEAERVEQESKGRLERQRITDQSDVEKARKELLEIQARSEATAHAESAKIEAESAVDQARLKAQAMNIEAEAELERLGNARESELKFLREQADLDIKRAKEMATIEVDKFKQMVDALGPDTLKAIALAGPELQVKMLQALGLKSTLITDGKTPLNLFSTAQGFIGANGDAVPPLPK
jgi:major vault protein